MSAVMVCTIGCFDILHVGHIDFLRQAAALGDMLIAGIPNDELYMVLKGHWPVMGATERVEMLTATRWVDYADILSSMDYAAWVDKIGPNILALSVDHKAERFDDAAAACEKNGGRVCRIERSPRNSTTAIIDRAIAIREGRI